jgi:hypothetical protein
MWQYSRATAWVFAVTPAAHMSPASRLILRSWRGLLAALIAAALLTGVLVPTATVQSSTSATAASAPTVKLSPTGSGSGTTVTASVKVEGCPAGKITIADTIGGTQTIAKDGAPATVVSHGTPGTYSVTATCTNGAHASAPFVVTKAKGPSIKLSPASNGPTPTTINVAV